MRLDKYLKLARIIKRRTVANEVCENGRVSLNGKVAKPSAEVKAGDIIEIRFLQGCSRVRVLDVRELVRKEEAGWLYEVLDGEELAPETAEPDDA